MKVEEFKGSRDNNTIFISADFTVVGGGLSGVSAAVVAARMGRKVVLVQDRPVLGGNVSSEVRLWALGSTSHMGNNNRWSREGGFINEVLLENLKRNRESNPLILDTILLEKVLEEPNIRLLLNSSLYDVEKRDERSIKSVTAFCSQNSTVYKIESPFVCDASGDGIVAFLAGASFRMGAEGRDEFDEGFAPNVDDYGELLGHSLYLYSKDTGKPVSYIAPSYAIKNAAELPRIKNYSFNDHGCRLWWIEYGGRLDTISESEDIKMELWKVIYGLWDHIKNSGEFPEAENLTLEWVGTIPGKRESRRFHGDYMISQKDLVEQRDHYDRVASGGWAMDLHPADGVYSKHNSCSQWHSKGVYTIPYRCYYSKDLDNLFLAGRIISASHVAFGSSRVMLTCALGGQAVGMAAHLCLKSGFTTREMSEGQNIGELQMELNSIGQSIPRLEWKCEDDLALSATVSSSSELILDGMEISDSPDRWQPLAFSTAQMLPVKRGVSYTFGFSVTASQATELTVEVRGSSSSRHFTPDVTLETTTYNLDSGENQLEFHFSGCLDRDQYIYLAFMQNSSVDIAISDERYSSIVSVQNQQNPAVSNFGRQDAMEGSGLESFEFWTPGRRPDGKNLALTISPPITTFQVENICNREVRPTSDGGANVWIASPDSEEPTVSFNWEEPQSITSIRIFFDADYDHALECNLREQPESVIPFIPNEYRVLNSKGEELYSTTDNHQAINFIKFNETIVTNELSITFKKAEGEIPPSIFKVMIKG